MSKYFGHAKIFLVWRCKNISTFVAALLLAWSTHSPSSLCHSWTLHRMQISKYAQCPRSKYVRVQLSRWVHLCQEMHRSARAALIYHFDLLGRRTCCKTMFYLFSSVGLPQACSGTSWMGFFESLRGFFPQLLQLAGLAGAFLAEVWLRSAKESFSWACVIICFWCWPKILDLGDVRDAPL